LRLKVTQNKIINNGKRTSLRSTFASVVLFQHFRCQLKSFLAAMEQMFVVTAKLLLTPFRSFAKVIEEL